MPNCPTCGKRLATKREGHQGTRSKGGWFYIKQKRMAQGIPIKQRGRPRGSGDKVNQYTKTAQKNEILRFSKDLGWLDR